MPSLDEEALVPDVDGEPEVELPPLATEAPPLERPAFAVERAQAAAVDAILFGALAVVVLYFTGRAARVDVTALAPSWPGIALYLGLLGLFYAGYFTGTTGQTPGKLMTGLRVLGASGRPPSYTRAMLREGTLQRYIHELSSRADKSFASINCGALPESLLESEIGRASCRERVLTDV